MNNGFQRGQEIGREQHTLPADYYRKIHLLFSRAEQDSLFAPIRSMQYLGVLDSQEIVFVDGQGPRVIELAWSDFQSQERDDLRAPVSYTCIFYEDKGRRILPRLQAEFLKALVLMEDRQPRPESGGVSTLHTVEE